MYLDKLGKAIMVLKPYTEYIVSGELNTEEDFNKIKWVTGESDGKAITTTTNPHSELTWTKVKTKMDEIDEEYAAQDYARKRQAEYPSIEELVVALYDTEDKVAIEAKRAEIKLKYPKP
jgi:hypothetical protein